MTPLCDSERVDVRRYCGYPAYGATPSGMDSARFFSAFGLLEFRMTNLSDSEVAVLRRYLGTLHSLEQAIPASGANLDTAQAAIWTRNKDEVSDRVRLFDEWRCRLCGFIGVPKGPALTGSTATLVV